MATSDTAVSLLRALVRLQGICLVVGSDAAVCEAFVEPATMEFRVDGSFLTMENGPWHIHLDVAQIRKITFEVKPDTAHHRSQLSYSIRFFAAHGEALLRAFFLDMYDDRDALRPERVQQFETLRAQYGDQDLV